MAKKSTTAQKKSRAELRKDLARNISAILNNPECPEILHQDIAQSVSYMSESVNFHAPEMLARIVEAYFANEDKRKGGAR
jgi:hypothetical protein